MVISICILGIALVEVPGWLDVEHALSGRGIILEVPIAGSCVDDGGGTTHRCVSGSHDAGACRADPRGAVGAEGAICGYGGSGTGAPSIGGAEGGGFCGG